MPNLPVRFPTLIITGMHRSGTSLTASLLQSAGVNIGEDLMSADQGNLKGYFENMDFVGFHEKILIERGIPKEGWTLERKIAVPPYLTAQAQSLIESNQALPAWGWKDPRTTLFLDFWAELLPDAKFIFIYRSPWEVVDSLYRRGSLGDEIFVDNPEFALALWGAYNQTILNFYQGNQERCLLFNLDTISPQPDFLLQGIKQKFGLDLSDIDNLYDESLITRSISWYRLAIIEQDFPEIFSLYTELNNKSDIPYQMSLPEEVHKNSQLHQLNDKDWILRDWVNTRVIERELKDYRQQLCDIKSKLSEFKDCSVLNQSELHLHLNKLNWLQAILEKKQTDILELIKTPSIISTELQKCQDNLENLEAEVKELQSKFNFFISHLHFHSKDFDQTQHDAQKILKTEGYLNKFYKAWFKIKKFISMK